jgi:hypothetical protein
MAVGTRKESIMEEVLLPLQLAPSNLNQSILPNWSFNLFSVNLGASSDSTVEHEVLQKVGSYGKQMGHLAEALEVVIKRLKLLDAKDLSQEELDVLQVFLGDVSATRNIKTIRRSARSTSSPSAKSALPRQAA